MKDRLAALAMLGMLVTPSNREPHSREIVYRPTKAKVISLRTRTGRGSKREMERDADVIVFPRAPFLLPDIENGSFTLH